VERERASASESSTGDSQRDDRLRRILISQTEVVPPHKAPNDVRNPAIGRYLRLCAEKRSRRPGLMERAQVTVRVSPSTLIVFAGSGWGAGGLMTEPSVIEYLLPWQSQLIVSVTDATGQA
jgi:hypothetical protein